MEESTLNASVAILVAVMGYLILLLRGSKRNLPPGPPSIPIIGHLHLLKPPMHRTFQTLSNKYGHVFHFRLGSHLAVIISSASAAEECFSKNDIALADRPHFSIMSKHVSYNFTTMTTAPYGDVWRNLRRIGSTEIFSTRRLNMFTEIREDEIKRFMINLCSESRRGSTALKLKQKLLDLTLNNIMRMVAGKRYYGNDEEHLCAEASEFKELMAAIISKSGITHKEDFMPVLILKLFYRGNFEEDIKILAKRTDDFLQRLIEDHRYVNKPYSNGTMIGHLLSLQESQPQLYNDETIKGLVLVMLVAGTDTSAVTMEWAMSYLVNDQGILQKASREVDCVIGEERLVSEADVPNLPYLNGIITETLRLRPAAPMLLPHFSSKECVVGGYRVPRDTMVIVNAWAIHRDAEVWEDAESFRPERFVGDSKQERNVLMPFGIGRRACPGSGMALRVVGLTLASLIQCFEWQRIGDELVDMDEGIGTIVSKANPLEIQYRPRAIAHKLLL